MTPHLERILVRGVNWLGDAVMTTPALLRLRERFPEAHIALLTPEKLRDLWLHHPAIDEIISFEAEQSVWGVAARIRRHPQKLEELKRRAAEAAQNLMEGNFAGLQDSSHRASAASKSFKRRKFDLALVLPNSPRSVLEVWLAGIPKRVGYTGNWRSWLLTQPIPRRPGAVPMRKRSVAEIRRLIDISSANAHHASRITQHVSTHHIHQYLHLAAALGANPEPLTPQLFVAPEEVEAVRKKFELTGIGQPMFGLNAGAEYGPAKRWPRERFVAAAIELQKRTNCRWLIFGGNADAELASQIAAEITHHASRITPLLNLAGKTSLRELMALLKLCRVLLTNDSGPMHVAAALGTPVVVPFGSTSPEMTGPGLRGDPRHQLLSAHVPCSPCFLRECPIDFRCMTGITVKRVVAATIDAMIMRL